MTDEQLRALVRDAVARHLAPARSDAAGPEPLVPAAMSSSVPASASKHAGFHRYLLPRADGDDGRCLIEPAVRCNHCGFCESHGY